MRAQLLAILAAFCVTVQQSSADTNQIPVLVEYFYEPGCRECRMINEGVLPAIHERFEGFYRLKKRDVGAIENIARLAIYQDVLNVASNEPVCMIIDHRVVLNGYASIRDRLRDTMDEALAARQDPDWRMAVSPCPPQIDKEQAVAYAKRRVGNFRWPLVLGAGLVDGINPCAISTIVFLMSLLTVSKVRGRDLLALGVAFCASSFLTYTAIGFGLLRVLYLFHGFPVLQAGFDMLLLAALAVLAYLSFRDAYFYRRSGDAATVLLQLPDRTKNRIRDFLRGRIGGGNLIIAGLLTGTGVTAMESVCTGQMYVPVLALVIKSGTGGLSEWTCLIGYNVAFILPLMVVFILTWFGLRTVALVEWSRRNVVVAKVLLGALFLCLAILIALL